MASRFTTAVVAIFSAYLCFVSYNIYGFFVPKSAPAGDTQCYQNVFEIDPVLLVRPHPPVFTQPCSTAIPSLRPAI
eukprot:1981942-Pyramimonas_sp.AAC.3